MRQMLITALGFVLVSGHAAMIAAPKVTRTPVSFRFEDRIAPTPDLITGDGLDYTDGVGGVSAVIFSSTGDAVLDTTSSRNPLRAIDYDLSQVISGTGPTTPMLSPSGLTIQGLAQMRVGDSKLTGAVFGTSIGQFQFLPGPPAATIRGTYVSATRVGDNTWTITTDGDVPESGDVAVLVQAVRGNQIVRTGSYHLPFRLTVTCPTCVAPL